MMAGRWLRSHRARMALALGLLLAVVGVLPSGAHAAGGPQSGEFGDPASDYMKYTFSGADFSGDPGGDFHYEGVSTGRKLSLSGTMIANREERDDGTAGLSYVTMKASLGDKSAASTPSGAGAGIASASSGGWVLKSTEVSKYDDDNYPNDCYSGHKVTVDGLSGTTYYRCSGGDTDVYQRTQHSWSAAPPERLAPGEILRITSTASVEGTFHTIGLGATASSWVRIDLRPGGGPYPGYAYASTTEEGGAPVSAVSEFSIPSGSEGGLMLVMLNLYSGAGLGQTTYTYEWKETASGATPGASGSGSTGGTSPDDGSSSDAKASGSGGITWGDAGGGLAAVAAVAIAAAAAKKPDGGELDPTTPVGYILDLSTRRIEFAAPKSSLWLTATVYDVYPDGRAEVSPGAEISFSPPSGVGVSPAAGVASVSAVVAHEGEIAPVSTLVVSASTAGGTHQDAVEIVAAVPQASLSLSFDPGEKSTLAAWGGDSVVLVGRVVFAEGASPDVVDAARASIDFASGSEWLDMSEAVDWGPDGRAVRIMASQPNPEHPVQPPESATVTCTATVADTELSQVASIALARNPTIDATPDTVHFAADSGATAEVRAWIESGSGLTWNFRTEWRDGSEPLADVAQTDEPPSAATLQLTEASGEKLDPSHPEQAATLRIIATATDASEEIELERYVKVIVAQEGLFIVRTGRDEDGSFHVLADGSATPAEVDFQVFARDAEGMIRAQPSLAEALEFEHTSDDGSRARNAAEVGNLSWAPGGTRSANNPATIWRFTVERQIPADVPVLHVPLEVSVPGMASDEKYVKELIIGLRASRDAPGGPDWQRELARCQRIIYDFVPVANHAKMMSILDHRSRALGADGLAEMRHQIWRIAQDLTLGEGGQGYLDEGKWAGHIETVLEYAEWAGNVAFHGATAHFLPFYHALAAAQVKELVVSAIQAYEDGISPGDWLWQNVSSVPWILEGQLIDVDKFTKLTGNDRAKAWALFVGYHFFKSYMYDGRTFTDSLIEAGRQARDEAIASWIGAELRTRAAPKMPEVQLPGRRTAPPGPPPQGPSTARRQAAGPSEQTRGKNLADRIDSLPDGPDGRKVLPQDLVTEIMRDPDGAREMRRVNPKAYEAYTQPRKAIHAEHDARLKKELESRNGWKVRVETFGTEKGIDRDYRVVREVPDPADPSKKVWAEVDRGMWQNDSHRIFAEQTGGPTGPNNARTRAAQAKHAQDHQQLATDQFHDQACSDMSDQVYVPSKNGRLVKVQRIGPDPKTGEMRPLSNLDLVESGNGRLHSGKELGDTYKSKVFPNGPDGKPILGPDGKPALGVDSITQAQKGAHTLEAVRDGYTKQGINPGPLDPKLRQGMNIVNQGASMKWDPETTNRALEQAGIKGGMEGYMKSMGDHFAKLDRAK